MSEERTNEVSLLSHQLAPSGVGPSLAGTALRLISHLPRTMLNPISRSRQVDTNTKNVFGQPRLRASLRDLRSPRKNYKSTIEDDLKKLIIMDNLAPDQERDTGVRSGLRGRARVEDLPPTATSASSCGSLAFDPCRPCMGVCGFVAGIWGITSSGQRHGVNQRGGQAGTYSTLEDLM